MCMQLRCNQSAYQDENITSTLTNAAYGVATGIIADVKQVKDFRERIQSMKNLIISLLSCGYYYSRTKSYIKSSPHSPKTKGKEIRTNLQNKGLISADRGTKATLILTIPRSLFKSYAKDLSLPIFELVFQHRLSTHFTARQCRYNVMILD